MTTPFRVASGVAAVLVYPLLITVVLAGAGMVDAGWLPGDGQFLRWALAAFFALGTVAVTPR